MMFSTLTQENVNLVETYEQPVPLSKHSTSKENNMLVAFIMLAIILTPIYIEVFMED